MSMRMSTHVVGFRPPDAKWEKMKSVWDACKSAGVNPPKEVVQFFGDQEPDSNGVVVDVDAALKEWRDEGREGYELELSMLPADITVIRFFNSWREGLW